MTPRDGCCSYDDEDGYFDLYHARSDPQNTRGGTDGIVSVGRDEYAEYEIRDVGVVVADAFD